MNRIYLTRIKGKKINIKDCLNNKKLGKLYFKGDQLIIKIKDKFKNHNLEQEAQFLYENKQELWQEYNRKVLADYNSNYIADLDNYHLPLYVETCQLKQGENDMFDRKTYLHPAALKAWKNLKKAAKKDKINLKIISAYRSLDYQKALIENKIAKGKAIKDILSVNTLPGFSEHHTGCAIDIGSPNETILESDFDQSTAFKWLVAHANKYYFYLSYPKELNIGIAYEPWHWCYKPPVL